MSIKFLVLGGGIWVFFRGGECRFYFYGREDFLKLMGGTDGGNVLRALFA